MVRHSQGGVLAQEKKTAEESVYDAASGGGEKRQIRKKAGPCFGK